jgi:FeS assembly SUF system protein
MEENQNPEAAPNTGGADAELKQKVIDVLKTVYDPEIPVDIYELGLVYTVDIAADNRVGITMTLTSPACPVAESLPPEVEQKVSAIEGVSGAKVEITWDPPWTPELMSEAARLTLGM